MARGKNGNRSIIPASDPVRSNGYDAMFMTALAIEAMGLTIVKVTAEHLRAISSAPGEIILPGPVGKRSSPRWRNQLHEEALAIRNFDENGDVAGNFSSPRSLMVHGPLN
jgi:branched-chain amino acid transport system substrate-binding protein